MKIVIIGAGDIGFDLARVLSKEKHDVSIIDNDPSKIRRIRESLDVRVVEGSATSGACLLQAGVENAEAMIAVTSIDEVNILASMIAKKYGVETVITRIRNSEISDPNYPLRPSDLGIDVMIHPEFSAAREIVTLLKRTVASDIIELADGRLQLIGIRLDSKSPIVGKTVLEFASDVDEIDFRVVAINRRSNTIMVRGAVRFQKDDQIFIIAKTQDIPRVIESTGRKETDLERIMIAGGTSVGTMITKMLCADEGKKWSIKLIEPDETKAIRLAETLPKSVLVLRGNPTDPDFLAQEGLSEADAFISVTEDEESNIISCLMAKHLEVKKTVALVSKPEYIPLSQTIGLDVAINKKLAASNEIHRHVRQGNVLSITSLHGSKADVIELEANKGSKVEGKPIHKIPFPKDAVVGGIIRNGSVEVATGSSEILQGDRVILFTLPEVIDQLEDLFS